MEITTLKKELYLTCCEYVKKREGTIMQIIASNQKALASETKSSAGDKHETGRAMLQLEIEKASQQLEAIHNMKCTLARIKLNTTSNVVKLGSLAVTNQASYFIAISAGEIEIDKQKYYAISLDSPIGKLLLGKTKNNDFIFNGKPIKIQETY